MLVFFFLLVCAVLIEVIFLQSFFKPGFIAPDIVLFLLLTKAYFHGRQTLLWAVFSGVLLDLLTDTVGLGITTQVFSLYFFLLVMERFLFRTALTFLATAGLTLLLKKILVLFLMKMKFSFEFSVGFLITSWIIELILLISMYFIYLRRYEQA